MKLNIVSEYNRGYNDAIDLMYLISKTSRFYLKVLARQDGKRVYVYLPVRKDVFNKFKKTKYITKTK